MGRPRIRDLDYYKITVDLSGDNKKYIDDCCDNSGLKYGNVINQIIKPISIMSHAMKKDVVDFILSQCDRLNALMEHESEMGRRALEHDKRTYLELAKAINSMADVDYIDIPANMKKIELKNGVLVIPKEWILLNPEDANECEYAGVVQFRNYREYDIPSFAFFTNTQYANQYDEDFVEHIKDLCREKWEKFDAILAMEVKLIRNPDNPQQFLNGEEYMKAPLFGIFHIDATDDPMYDGHPACDARIERC